MPEAPEKNCDFVRIANGGWVGMVNAEYAGLFEDRSSDWPDPWLSGDTQEVNPIKREGVQVYPVEIGGVPCYVKYFTSHKGGGRKDKLWNRLMWRFGRSRAQQNLTANLMLERAGFGAAEVLLAVRKTSGMDAEDLFVTQAVDGRTFHHELIESGEREKKELLVEAGKSIAELHAAGIIHGDLLPRNLIIGAESQRIYFLDNDRTRKWRWFTPTRQKWRNVEQMLYRLLIYHRYRTLKSFMHSYIQHCGHPPSQARGYAAKIIKRVRQRWVEYARELEISSVPDDVMPDESRRWRVELHAKG